MPDLNWNQWNWGSNYPWHDGGEEWSTAWGGSEAQWFGCIFPRLHRFLPAKRILEIAPGFGRWTRFLIPACEEFVGIDLAQKCIDTCRTRFADVKHATFVTNDGHSLSAAPDKRIDLVFSFDSLVHAECDVMESYLPQILRKLSPQGVAFLHHSNLHAYGGKIGQQHGRGMTVSADSVAEILKICDGQLLIQEVVNWGGEHMIDCLTLFARGNAFPSVKPVRLQNPVFMGESKLIQHFQSHYSTLFAADAKRDAA